MAYIVRKINSNWAKKTQGGDIFIKNLTFFIVTHGEWSVPPHKNYGDPIKFYFWIFSIYLYGMWRTMIKNGEIEIYNKFFRFGCEKRRKNEKNRFYSMNLTLCVISLEPLEIFEKLKWCLKACRRAVILRP